MRHPKLDDARPEPSRLQRPAKPLRTGGGESWVEAGCLRSCRQVGEEGLGDPRVGALPAVSSKWLNRGGIIDVLWAWC